MSLIPKVYRSTDPGAPALTGQPGALAALLDAVLVNGYGSGSNAKSAAGWTREFNSANKRVYRNSAVSGSGSYLRVDDSGSLGNARWASLRVYGSMSDVDTGLGETPSTSELSGGAMWLKSTALDAVSRPWAILANERWLYFFMAPANDGIGIFSNVPYAPFFAGDFNSCLPGDADNFLLTGTNTSSYAAGSLVTSSGAFWSQGAQVLSNVQAISSRAHLLRGYDRSTPSVRAGIVIPGDLNLSSYNGAGTGSSRVGGPSPVSGGYTFLPLAILEGNGLIRGYLPNVYAPLEWRPFPHGVPVEGVSGFELGTILLPWLWSSWWQAPNPSWAEVGMVVFDLTSDRLTP